MREIGIDIGGTFTDVVCLVDRRKVHAVKVQNSGDLIRSVIDGVDRVLRETSGDTGGDLRVAYMHGTTVATNAVLEGRGAVTACLATKGFEDVIEIGRQKRSRMYDLDLAPETPSFVSPRRMRAGITERIDGAGNVLVALDEAQVIRTVRELHDRFAIQSIAVCYLNAYRNGAHEVRTRELIRAHFPEIAVSISSEVNPVFREYERTCVTVFDAYVRPLVERYIERLASALQETGAAGQLQIMQSRGGVGSVKMAAARPVSLLLSGPAAGVVGARLVGEWSGERDLIGMDIGGTTCDVSLIRGGAIELTREGRLRGFPLRLLTTDITSVGSGGGSIAWLDAAGGLHVGPRSAGADPGPACYGLGAEEPTTTDASVVLGYLNPKYFAGGTMKLDPELANRAVGRLADRLKLSVDATALGMHRILNVQMAEAVRLVTVKRGYDPRRFALVAFGGAGPVHASEVAKLLGIRKVIVPHSPGTLAAFGLLVADLEYEASLPVLIHQDDIDVSVVSGQFAKLGTQGIERLVSEGLPPADIQIRRWVDLRYAGQSFELEVPFGDGPVAIEVTQCIAAFHRRHAEVFGHADVSRSVEFVNLRTVHFRHVPPPKQVVPVADIATSGEAPEYRSVCFDASSRVNARIYRRSDEALRTGIAGPCIVEQSDTTTVLRPGETARVDGAGNLIVNLIECEKGALRA